ncbi:TetR/AcrR family transcriptional regulator [Mycobacterium sp.]|uniref:TetR/AcrR family transcriptional regulator n=1 Tax=Mycobacterium sp. TaxID=1785 RepID=UPI00121D84C5|nr:TetR/AcrR family transcriptional regulator [Mycobacterium sp.]TAM65652.1 MAG: TetR/AcrR family transcriptional regulator [Mycobacterium sp.]
MPQPDLQSVVRVAGRRRRPAGDATRRRLLDSGRRIFAEEGFAGAGTQEIVMAAGVAPTALYHHFGNKLGLFVAVGAEVYDVFIGHLRAAVATAESFDDRLDALMRASGELHRSDPTLAPMTVTVQLEVARNEQIRAAMSDTFASFSAFVTDIARTAPADLTENVGVRGVALTIVGIMQGLGSLGATLHDPDDLVATTVVLRRLLAANRTDKAAR